MYGLILLTATMSSPGGGPVPAIVSPQIGCFGSCQGCYGSCYGSASCYGSCHGLGHGCRGGLFGHHRNSCHGCTSYNCNGWNCFGSCHGCRGSCHGCSGSSFGSCHGCGGGCYGSVWNNAVVPPGVGFGPSFYSNPWAVYGTVNAPPAVVIPVAATAGTTDPKPMDKPVAPPPKEGMGASLKFQLPADAKLYVDGRLTLLAGTERVFTTPPLAAGQKFYYDVKAELTVDGKPVVEEKRVVVEGGSDLTESFAVLIAAVQGKSAPVAGK